MNLETMRKGAEMSAAHAAQKEKQDFLDRFMIATIAAAPAGYRSQHEFEYIYQVAETAWWAREEHRRRNTATGGGGQ
jgi:hypothetical protein